MENNQETEQEPYRGSIDGFSEVELLKELKRRSDEGLIEIVWLEESDEITTHGSYEEIRDKRRKYSIKIHELNHVKETRQY